MNEQKDQLGLLDAIAIVSFCIGLANYGENVDQSTMNNAVKRAVMDVHEHLAEQDQKLSQILEKLGGDL